VVSVPQKQAGRRSFRAARAKERSSDTRRPMQVKSTAIRPPPCPGRVGRMVSAVVMSTGDLPMLSPAHVRDGGDVPASS